MNKPKRSLFSIFSRKDGGVSLAMDGDGRHKPADNDEQYSDQETIVQVYEESISDLFMSTFENVLLGTAFVSLELSLTYINPALKEILHLDTGSGVDTADNILLKNILSEASIGLINMQYDQLISGVTKNFEHEFVLNTSDDQSDSNEEGAQYRMHFSGIYSKSESSPIRNEPEEQAIVSSMK